MRYKRKARTRLAILADELGENDGVKSAGHAGDDEHHGEHGIKVNESAEKINYAGDYNKPDSREDICSLVADKLLYNKGRERHTRKDHAERTYAGGCHRDGG